MHNTVLITGASGLIGRSLLHYYLKKIDKQQITVKAVYSEDTPFYFKTPEYIQWINEDLNNKEKLDKILQDVDVVYHCAGFTNFSTYYNHQLQESNDLLTKNIVNSCLKNNVSKLVYVSSSSFLLPDNSAKDALINETINENKISFSKSSYHESKFFAELQVWRGIYEGLPSIIINPTLIIGTSKKMGKYNSILYKFAKRSNHYPTGSYGFVGSEDVAKIMYELMESDIKNQRFIVNAENKTFHEILTITKKIVTKRAFTLKPFTEKKAKAFRTFFYIKKKSPFVSDDMSSDLLDFLQQKQKFDNKKLLKALPHIKYKPVKECIYEAFAPDQTNLSR